MLSAIYQKLTHNVDINKGSSVTMWNMYTRTHAHTHTKLCLNLCWCLYYMLAFAKLLITFSISMYIMCVILCLFSALSRRVRALQISIIITSIIIMAVRYHTLLQPTAFVHRGRDLARLS